MHPHSSQWDNGPNSAAELDRLLKVREIAMKNFSESAIRPGRADGRRWRMCWCRCICCTATRRRPWRSSIGGEDYRYAVRGDGQTDRRR